MCHRRRVRFPEFAHDYAHVLQHGVGLFADGLAAAAGSSY